MKKIIVLLFLLLLLAGCSSLEKGYVYDKIDFPAHWTWTQIAHTTCEKVGNSEECSTYYTPQMIYHPELLELAITNCTPSEQKVRTDCQMNEHYVNRDVFDKYHVGDYVDLTNS